MAPEYADLVAENLRRRLAGAHGAERFEVEMVGLQGQVSLLELTTAPIDFEGTPALLVTGVEVIPTKKLRALASGKIDEKEAAARAALVAPPLPPPPPRRRRCRCSRCSRWARPSSPRISKATSSI